ncbi:hypothetical protein SNE40_004688 [Patella caerulea]|uniref:protein-tyrosine-phosphatase n=1 Tax=Patella caerulea TaxID=87958 RepID=A0AAN8PYE9_PATCE
MHYIFSDLKTNSTTFLSFAGGLRDLQRRCPDGYFGYKCRFRCRCRGSENCNKDSGTCPTGCADGFWGPGCQLSNNCYYNGRKRNYMGTKSMTKSLYTCQRWDSQYPHQHSYKEHDFPERKFTLIYNYCRTTPDSNEPWCYTNDRKVRWEHCSINNCVCPPGRFGNNCEKECHCRDSAETCDSILGFCTSGCAAGWNEYDCQTAEKCSENRYGWDCSQRCHCQDPGDCDRFTGPTRNCACRKGYFKPPFCEPVTEPRIVSFKNTKVNPGQSSEFNCTVAAFPTPYQTEIQLVGPMGRKITLIDSQLLDKYLYTRANRFLADYVMAGDRFMCVVKATAGQTQMTVVAETFDLPRLISPPFVIDGTTTAHNVTIRWRKWGREQGDSGEGPILSYYIYIKVKGTKSYQKTGVVYHSFCDTSCRYVITELMPFTEYAIYIVTSRDGPGGEGVPGPIIHFTTACKKPSAPPTLLSVKSEKQMNGTTTKTKISLTWQDPDRRTINCREITSYTVQLTNDDGSGFTQTKSFPKLSKSGVIKDMDPFSTYCVKIRFQTDVNLNSPFSTSKCVTTPVTIPGRPEGLRLIKRSSTSVTFRWERPEPSFSKETLYRIIYREGTSTSTKGLEWRSGDETVEYTLTGLKPFTSYQIQVQASNNAGTGKLSPILTASTDESVPGPVPNFRNTSRSRHFIKLEWDKPDETTGQILYFTVTCSSLKSLHKPDIKDHRAIKLDPATLTYTMQGLSPATQYACSVNASNQKGSGAQSSILTWTEAKDLDTPVTPKVVETSDRTVTINLKTNGDQSVSFYRIIVENVGSRKRRSSPKDIGQVSSDAMTAARYGSSAYIAAQLEHHMANGPFVVGDNKTYGGFYNAPLETDKSYNIWFGAYSKIDGTLRQSFSRTEPVVVRAVSNDDSSSHIPVIIGVLVVFILLIILFAVLLVVWRKRNSSAEREKCDFPNFGPTIMPEPDSSPPLTPMTNIEAEPLIIPSSLNDIECEPIYSNVGTNIPPIRVEDLWDFIKNSKEQDYSGFKREYKLIPAGLIASCEVAKRNENKPKNRYGNIIAYDHTRVMLVPEDGDPTDDYINANYIDGYNKPKAYIAAQGPNTPTINDIWRMMWQLNSKTIIMLTNSTESGKKKCEQYWPDYGSEEYGNYTVQILNSDFLPDFTIRTFLLSTGDQSKYVKQFHYTTWPDHGVPKFGNSLLLFRQKIRAFDKLDNGPVVVHCSAGVGRTGTYISVDSQLERAKSEGIIDVHNFVQLMRTQRVNMVQTLEQYIFVYDCLLEALICGDTTIPVVNYPTVYRDLVAYNQDLGKSKLDEQFEILKLLSTTIERDESTTALRAENIFKNRCKNILPANRCRPYLITPWEEGNDYINAVFVNSYHRKDAFIVTQMSLPNTVVDFWRLVYDHNSSCIVMLNELDLNDETCEVYWSLDPCGISYGPFIVETTAEIKSDPSVTIRDFTITNTLIPDDPPRVIRQFHFHHWADGSTVPSSKMALLELLDMVERWQHQTDNTSVTVHCMNGASRSGLFCAVSCILERLNVEKEIDVFQAVKQLRLNRSQFIDNMEQYKFCHDVVLDYLKDPESPSALS